MMQRSPFHDGEQAVQTRLGVRETIEPWARQVVRPYLPEEHRRFHTALPFIIAAARDHGDHVWVTLLTGDDGFIRSPDARHLQIRAALPAGDALTDALTDDADVGLLGIELHTRRRNRVNGHVEQHGDGTLHIAVDQTFGNCPQYINPRPLRRVASSDRAVARRDTKLNSATRAWIERADTCFIGSGYRGTGERERAHGMDASHRGGERGFVKVLNDRSLVFPDYAGNNHFNTIGNLEIDPRAGLLFVDFASGGLLQLSGRTRIDWDSETVGDFPGAQRLVYFDIARVVELERAVPLRWDSPAEFVRTLRVVGKRRESEDVTSFELAARDDGSLPHFEAGQHLPIELDIPGQAQPVRRTYSLSGAPGQETYRISVKREAHGIASGFLHDQLEPGGFINAWPPAGDFVAAPGAPRPLVLISAGVGMTPLLSMLHAHNRAAPDRDVWFIHGARDSRHHPLADEVRTLAATSPNVRTHIAYSKPLPDDRRGHDYDTEGRIDAATIAALIPDLSAEFFICGPQAFMSAVQSGLVAHGAAQASIHVETFGPTG